jgi:hypothetical protein
VSKSHISATTNADGTDSESQIRNLSAAFNGMRDILDTDRPDARPEKEVTQFSDSIVISFPATSESGVFYALLDIMWVQASLVFHGILCRGGIARGKLIHTPKLLFGPALVEAYALESKAALYPRVILDKSIIEAGISAHSRHHLPHHEEQSIMSLVKMDADGMYYIDYITEAQSELNDPELDYPGYLSRLRDIIADGIEASDPSVAVKYMWLREKFSPHLSQRKAAARTAPEGDELREAYESITDI